MSKINNQGINAKEVDESIPSSSGGGGGGGEVFVTQLNSSSYTVPIGHYAKVFAYRTLSIFTKARADLFIGGKAFCIATSDSIANQCQNHFIVNEGNAISTSNAIAVIRVFKK